MSHELLVKFNEIEQSISRIEKSLSAFNAELPKNTGEGNNLDVVNRLNELNHMMTEVGNAYKQILAENNQTVRESVQQLENADKELSSSIQLR
ncbi:DUF5344 family protein [Guptibacillus hwajinpoensis]|uniref:YwqI/YxiC family protein n=1 Tax=Guptibacillus hwajinpoensis TaxID=208199 RepID=A0A0J6CSB2_9BACL|nr:DUF5344 family protein [Alkalihalobacillus macyae]KMM39171.1 hypothetical protein AB986_08070 [Alkalihalobacillus macyae]